MLTAAGFATEFPPLVQVAVKPVVVNNVVRFMVESVHFATDLSTPRFGFMLAVTFRIAVSEQPLLLLAINWYAPDAVTAVGLVTVVPPKVQFAVKPVVTNCVVRFTDAGLQTVTALSAPKFGRGVKFTINESR